MEHYVISSGNAEIIEGTAIASRFRKIYGSRFIYDQNGVPSWPALAINFTTKTQFLFRINKGAHDPSDSVNINRFVPLQERPVPFENMVYIGDGETDVPCFRLVKSLGGLSVAVFPPDRDKNASVRADGPPQGRPGRLRSPRRLLAGWRAGHGDQGADRPGRRPRLAH